MLLELLFEKAAILANHVASFMPSRKARNSNGLSFAEIPADLFFMLLEHMDYQEILKMGLVNKRFQHLISNKVVWQKLIEQYFPYLMQQEADDYNENAFLLFVKEYKVIRSKFKDISLQYVMSALRGKHERLPPVLSMQRLEHLNIIAAANGHGRCEAEQLPLILRVATWINNVARVRLLLQSARFVRPAILGAYFHASIAGSLRAMRVIEEHANFRTREKIQALIFSSNANQAEVVSYLCARNRRKPFFQIAIGQALIACAAAGNLNTLQILLPHDNPIIAGSIFNAIEAAIVRNVNPSLNNKIEIVRSLLQRLVVLNETAIEQQRLESENTLHEILKRALTHKIFGMQLIFGLFIQYLGKRSIPYDFAVKTAIENGDQAFFNYLMDIRDSYEINPKKLFKMAYCQAGIADSILTRFNIPQETQENEFKWAFYVHHNIDLVDVLAKHGDFEIPEDQTVNCYMFSCTNGVPHLTRKVLLAHCDKIRNFDLAQGFSIAIIQGHFQVVEEILKLARHKLSHRDIGHGAFLACHNRRLSLLEYFFMNYLHDISKADKRMIISAAFEMPRIHVPRVMLILDYLSETLTKPEIKGLFALASQKHNEPLMRKMLILFGDRLPAIDKLKAFSSQFLKRPSEITSLFSVYFKEMGEIRSPERADNEREISPGIFLAFNHRDTKPNDLLRYGVERPLRNQVVLEAKDTFLEIRPERRTQNRF